MTPLAEAARVILDQLPDNERAEVLACFAGDDEMLTPKAAAARLGCHPDTIRRMVRTGKLFHIRTGEEAAPGHATKAHIRVRLGDVLALGNRISETDEH